MDLGNSIIENIKLIIGTSELRGGGYFEFAPGSYTEKHWQKDWVYLEEEVFLLLEPVSMKIIPCFGGDSPNEISRSNWLLIIERFKTLKIILKNASSIADIRGNIRFSESFETVFFEHFDECRNAVIKLITDLTKWLDAQLKTHEKISVLGI